MELNEILNEISIGFNNADEKSKKMKSYVDEVKAALEQHSGVVENRTLSFSVWDSSTDSSNNGSQIFYQGSYATHTAIKSSRYDVDVDIAFYIDEYLPVGMRNTIYKLLYSKFNSRYNVELKKPCITIDFNDGYKIDVTIYSKSNNYECLNFHNSIDGLETKIEAKPKKIVQTFNDYLKIDDMKRPIIRLMKHFCKNTIDNLSIAEENKIPTIALMLIALKNYEQTFKIISEEGLLEELQKFTQICINYFDHSNIVECSELLISNTLYKVKNFNDLKRVFDTIQLNLNSQNYSAITSKSVSDKLAQKNPIKPALLGTMG